MSVAPRPLWRRYRLAKALRRWSEHLIEALDLRYRLRADQLVVERVPVRLPRLAPAFHGYTIAQISDLHYGPLVEPHSLRTAIEAAARLQPQLIAVTGDFVSRLTHGEAALVARELGRLRHAAPDGAFAVLGNHDWWEDVDELSRALRAAGLTLLRNEHAVIRCNGAALYLAGVDDARERKADLRRALAGIPLEAAVVLLAHEPYFAEIAARDQRVVLQLSGHSHGGQVRLPHVEDLVLRCLGHHKYPRGLNRLGALQVYTNRGLGVVGLPLRHRCPPEVTLLTLLPA